MAIPAFNEHDLLPDGIHDCTLEEAQERFGCFQTTDRRPWLWSRFEAFLRELMACGVAEALLINGSFVTAAPSPNDIDMVVLVSRTHDFGAELAPGKYNALSKRNVRRRYGFDIVLARAGTDDETETASFFQQVRGRPDLRKGILRIRI